MFQIVQDGTKLVWYIGHVVFGGISAKYSSKEIDGREDEQSGIAGRKVIEYRVEL